MIKNLNIHRLPRLGIIAGNGILPAEIAKIYLKKGGICYIAAIESEADIRFLNKFSNFKSFPIGSIGAVFKYFNNSGVKNIIFAGGVKRMDIKSLKVDLTGSLLMTKILKQKFLGDDNLLRIIADFFTKKGFKVISAIDILTIDNEKIATVQKPFKQDINDIELGIKIIKALGDLDIGQAVIVEDGYVLGIEAAEGTDVLIKRCADLRKKDHGGILVKMSKISQDMRVDIPTIGPKTIRNLAKYNYNGIAVEQNKVIILEPENTLKIAREHKIFITDV